MAVQEQVVTAAVLVLFSRLAVLAVVARTPLPFNQRQVEYLVLVTMVEPEQHQVANLVVVEAALEQLEWVEAAQLLVLAVQGFLRLLLAPPLIVLVVVVVDPKLVLLALVEPVVVVLVLLITRPLLPEVLTQAEVAVVVVTHLATALLAVQAAPV